MAVNRPTSVYYIGSLVDDVLDNERVCIVTATNAITCQNYGHTNTVICKYPYGNVPGMRYTEIGHNYACRRDRGFAGTIIENRHSTNVDKPTIVTMVTQYGIGTTIEDNSFAQKAVMYLKDEKHVESLRRDTKQERIINFNQCLDEMRTRLLSKQYHDIEFLVLPFGIGRPGKLDNVWIHYYYPAIEEFALFAKIRGKTVVFTIGQEYYNELMKTDNIVYRDTIRNMDFITDFGESIHKCGTDTVY